MADFGETHLNELASWRALGETPREVSKKIRELEADNQKQRRELETANAAAATAPKDGEIVLTKDQAPTWTKYQALGKPEDLEKQATELVELREKDKVRTRRDGIAAAVEAEELPATLAGVIGKLQGVEALTFGADKKKGKDPKTGADVEEKFGTVTPAGEGAKSVRLTDYIKETWPELEPLLTAAPAGTTTTTTRMPAPGVTVVASRTGNGSPPAPAEGDALAAKAANGNYTF